MSMLKHCKCKHAKEICMKQMKCIKNVPKVEKKLLDPNNLGFREENETPQLVLTEIYSTYVLYVV